MEQDAGKYNTHRTFWWYVDDISVHLVFGLSFTVRVTRITLFNTNNKELGIILYAYLSKNF